MRQKPAIVVAVIATMFVRYQQEQAEVAADRVLLAVTSSGTPEAAVSSTKFLEVADTLIIMLWIQCGRATYGHHFCPGPNRICLGQRLPTGRTRWWSWGAPAAPRAAGTARRWSSARRRRGAR